MIIRSKDRRWYARIELLPARSPRHRGWISYNLVLGAADRSLEVSLLGSEDELFLDDEVEEEVLALCQGLMCALKSKSKFVFEPCDEADFTLELWHQREGFFMRIEPQKACSEELLWLKGVEVLKEDIEAFVEGLKVEHALLKADGLKSPK